MNGATRMALAGAVLALAASTPAYSQNYFSHGVLVVPEVRVDRSWVQVIETKEEWEAFYGEHSTSAANAPPIDFATYRVVAGGLGMQPMGGDQIAVERVYDLGNTVLVSVLVVSAGANCGVTAMVTWPTTAIVIPQGIEPVTVSTTSAVHNCE